MRLSTLVYIYSTENGKLLLFTGDTIRYDKIIFFENSTYLHQIGMVSLYELRYQRILWKNNNNGCDKNYDVI